VVEEFEHDIYTLSVVNHSYAPIKAIHTKENMLNANQQSPKSN